ncbi:MAG: putative iron-regulated protein [Patiriisocius sp.]|jgi:uncharacterized iron-regulated protein
MKMKILLITLLVSCQILGQDLPAYKLFNSKGKEASFKELVEALEECDIALFGENHDNPIAHWLQYEVTKELNSRRSLTLGAEMLESDNQDELNDYLSGVIDAEAFDTLARLWTNHATDYAPLVDFAKENKLRFIATNIPRRYAKMVYKKGFAVLDSLTDKEKSWIAPLPITFDPDLATYQNILVMMGEHGTPELVMAQATKDATMAHFILKNYVPGKLFLHYNGAYHSNNYEGILWYLKLEQPQRRYVTISTVDQKDIKKLEKENKGIADFVICVDSDMTTTY